MDDIALKLGQFDVSLDGHTGGLTRIGHRQDRHGMNWITGRDVSDWQMDSQGWGLGFAVMPGHGLPLHRWQRAASIRTGRGSVKSTYGLPGLEVRVTRRSCGRDQIEERFEFVNVAKAPQAIWGAGLYVPFNDNYPDARTCLTGRCNAHIWCGGSTTYACCLRMGAEPPHLGLVLTEGSISGYSIENRGLLNGGSNTRGTFVFNLTGFTLKPRQMHRVAWRLFWHEGWDDFFDQAGQLPSFARVEAANHTVVKGSSLAINVRAKNASIEWNGERVAGTRRRGGLRLVRRIGEAGEQTVKVRYGGGRETWLKALVVPKVTALVRKRVEFIRDHQQVVDRASPVHGAFLSYDNALEARFNNPEWRDQDEGRERIAMGVVLAQSIRRWRDRRTVASLDLHHRFVRRRLQRPDGTVLNAVSDATQRLYNYPWVAQFHLEMHRSFGGRRYLRDYVDTMRMYYRRGGDGFYAIGVPIADGMAALRKAGMTKEAAELLACFVRHADRIVAAGLNFPPHEVNYEQTIVGPAVLIPLEAYLVTRNVRYLDHVRRLLPCLDAFNGRQPDYHLHEIAIRHWDGYWFGGRRTWGDTFPHYWTAASGFAYCRYWQATGDDAYRRKARTVLMNNLCSFGADGRARCVYIYPDAVNGNPGRFWDPLANDQDWAMAFLLQAAEVDAEFERDCWTAG